MIRTILIDDEPHCLQVLVLLLTEYCPHVFVIDTCRSAAEGIRAIEKGMPDLVFLDIEMPVTSGLEMLEHFAKLPFTVIFTTSHDQYAIKAIRFSALDYLLKPIDKSELMNAVTKVKERLQLPLAEQFEMLLKKYNNKTEHFNKIAVPTSEGFELIPVAQLIRCEANDNYTFLFVKNRGKIVACRTLKEIEEQLEAFDFFVRVHHSYIVNLNEVIKYIRGDGGYLIMSDSATVNVSRSRKELLLKRF